MGFEQEVLGMTCSLDGCSKLVFSRGWCQMHYARWLRHGDPSFTRTPGRETGRRTRGGPYIYIRLPGCPLADSGGWIAEHRAVMWALGLLVNKTDLVHHVNGDKTDNRRENLEVLSASEHMSHHQAARRGTHCKNGHEMTPENTFVRKGQPNRRECRECQRERQRRHREKAAQ